jgi:hypothetical protein
MQDDGVSGTSRPSSCDFAQDDTLPARRCKRRWNASARAARPGNVIQPAERAAGQ